MRYIEYVFFWLFGEWGLIELMKLNDHIKHVDTMTDVELIELREWLISHPKRYHKEKFEIWIRFVDIKLKYFPPQND